MTCWIKHETTPGERKRKEVKGGEKRRNKKKKKKKSVRIKKNL